VPDGWESYVVHYRFGESVYHIAFKRGPGPAERADRSLRLVDDGREHDVEVAL